MEDAVTLQIGGQPVSLEVAGIAAYDTVFLRQWSNGRSGRYSGGHRPIRRDLLPCCRIGRIPVYQDRMQANGITLGRLKATGNLERYSSMLALHYTQGGMKEAVQMKQATGGIAVEGRHIIKNFRIGNTTAEGLKDISLQATQGKFVSIVGPSGFGKSTLLCILGGLDTPVSGHVLLNGADISRFGDEKMSRIRRAAACRHLPRLDRQSRNSLCQRACGKPG